MVTSELLNSLGRKNLSKNADLSAERFSEDLTAASAKQKQEIAELAERSRATLYKVKSDGIISARLLVATSFVLNVSPYWYTGQADTKEEYSDEIMRKFLKENKYESALIIEQEQAAAKGKTEKPKRQYKRREKPSPAPAAEPPQVANEEPPQEEQEEPTESADNGYFNVEVAESLSFESAVKLLESLYIRAAATQKADTALSLIKKLLLQS